MYVISMYVICMYLCVNVQTHAHTHHTSTHTQIYPESEVRMQGIVNILYCGLASRARIVFCDKFEATKIVTALSSGAVSIFMAVPTVYHKLLAAISVYISLSLSRALSLVPSLSLSLSRARSLSRALSL